MTQRKIDQSSAEQEDCFHNYVSNVILWYVRLIWLLFQIFVVYIWHQVFSTRRSNGTAGSSIARPVMHSDSSSACDYCGLPFVQSRIATQPDQQLLLYCCLGCRWAAEITQQSGGRKAPSAGR